MFSNDTGLTWKYSLYPIYAWDSLTDFNYVKGSFPENMNTGYFTCLGESVNNWEISLGDICKLDSQKGITILMQFNDYHTNNPFLGNICFY